MYLWLLLAVLAAIGEVLTLGLYFASIAGAAAVTAVAAPFTPLALQVVLFLVLSLVGIAVLRPLVIDALGLGPRSDAALPATHSHLAGRRAVVTRTVDGFGGQIRLGDGEFWSARAYDPDDILAPGRPVEIQVVDGLTALVTPATVPSLTSELDTSSPKGR